MPRKDDDQPLATPDDYALIFEQHTVGQKVLQDLIYRFGRTGSSNQGIDRVLDTFERQGSRKVLDHIVLKINQSNGVKNYADDDIEVSVTRTDE